MAVANIDIETFRIYFSGIESNIQVIYSTSRCWWNEFEHINIGSIVMGLEAEITCPFGPFDCLSTRHNGVSNPSRGRNRLLYFRLRDVWLQRRGLSGTKRPKWQRTKDWKIFQKCYKNTYVLKLKKKSKNFVNQKYLKS